jgi:hypothetical protein
MAIEHVQSAVVHSWRCTRCGHHWDVYGGDPFDYDSDEAPRGVEPVVCPHCLTAEKAGPTERGRAKRLARQMVDDPTE